MKNIIATLLLITPFISNAQHTFSIVAVDSITKEIGSAGATCGDSIIWPGTTGALIISDIIPGVGAIHTQAAYLAGNKLTARRRMLLRDSPEAIITHLLDNDQEFDASIRQYGIVDYNEGSPRSAAYTGVNCFDYKNHILGPNYAIQGNILLGQEILDAMERRFNNTSGCLADKLMAAMQGAKVIGADTRCRETSSLSAFLRVAQAADHRDTVSLDINIAATPPGVEPIDELQSKYDKWKNNNNHNCLPVLDVFEADNENVDVLIYPNPTEGLINITSSKNRIAKIIVIDISGNLLIENRISKTDRPAQVFLNSLSNGIYFLTLFDSYHVIATKKITILK